MKRFNSLFFALLLFAIPEARAQDQVVFQYMGGPQPPELTVLDVKDTNDVEFGVPRYRLFDGGSPLNGTMADMMEFPGPDDSTDTGILIKTGVWSDSATSFATLCLRTTITRTSSSFKFVKCKITRAGGFMLSPEAKMVEDAGGRNNWARIIRKLKKAEADRNPRNANRTDRLRRRIDRKAEKDDGYKALLDGTHYMPDVCEETFQIEFTTTTETFELVFYLTIGDLGNFDSHGVFIPQLEVSLTDQPGPDNANMGSVEDNALVVDQVDVAIGENVPFVVYDGVTLFGLPPDTIDPDLGIIFANWSQFPNDTLVIGLNGYPDAIIPPWDGQPETFFEAPYVLLTPQDTIGAFAFTTGGTFQQEFPLFTGTRTIRTGFDDNLFDDRISLYPNYPNPFTTQTTLNYELTAPGNINLSIYNLAGQRINTLINSYQPPGTYQIPWNGEAESGNIVTSGLYFYRLETGSEVETGKMVFSR